LGVVRKELAERAAIRFEFSLGAISSAIGLFSALFIAAGFLYVRYFYQRLGVDVSLYFSIGDYLAASIEQIRIGAFSAVSALVIFAFGMRVGSMRSRLHIRSSAASRRREGWLLSAFTVAIWAAVAYSFYPGNPDYERMRGACVISSYWVADFIAGAFFKNRLAAMAALVGAMIFATNVGISAYENSEKLILGKVSSEYTQELHFKEKTPQVVGELFGANGSYYFVFSRDERVVHVVPRDRVAQIDITHKKK
jgi:hypothetical protein